MVNPCDMIWNWDTQATMAMQAMRCAEEAYGLYYFFDSSRELLCYSPPWVFFSVLFRSVGAPPVYWWQLVGAVYLIYLVILLTGIFSSRYGFRESRRGWQQPSCLDVYSPNDSISQCRASGCVGKCIFALANLTLSELRRSAEFLLKTSC